MDTPSNTAASSKSPETENVTLKVSDFPIAGPDGQIMLRLHRPATASPLPLVLYFHGGGFVGGSLDDADIPASFIARHCQAAVLSVGYALAPARPFPAAPEDGYAALEWSTRHAAAIGADARHIAVAGDDAGGNLAACLSLMARDRNTPQISAQALIGPMLDPSMTRLGDAARLKSDITAASCLSCYQQYLPQSLQRLHPYAAPLESRRLRGLPPAFIATAECDVLHNEAEKYAAALIEAGVHTQVARFAGVTHAGLPAHPALLRAAADFLRRQLTANRS
jgi:acetyl esterase